jgi:uncharacterized membrane protein
MLALQRSTTEAYVSFALDIVWAFCIVCLIGASVSGIRTPDTNRLLRALNFTPANICLRVFCGMTAVRGVAELAERYGAPWPMSVLRAISYDAALALVLFATLILLGYALVARPLQMR